MQSPWLLGEDWVSSGLAVDATPGGNLRLVGLVAKKPRPKGRGSPQLRIELPALDKLQRSQTRRVWKGTVDNCHPVKHPAIQLVAQETLLSKAGKSAKNFAVSLCRGGGAQLNRKSRPRKTPGQHIGNGSALRGLRRGDCSVAAASESINAKGSIMQPNGNAALDAAIRTIYDAQSDAVDAILACPLKRSTFLAKVWAIVPTAGERTVLLRLQTLRKRGADNGGLHQKAG